MIPATRKSVCAIIPAFGEARFIGTVVGGFGAFPLLDGSSQVTADFGYKRRTVSSGA